MYRTQTYIFWSTNNKVVQIFSLTDFMFTHITPSGKLYKALALPALVLCCLLPAQAQTSKAYKQLQKKNYTKAAHYLQKSALKTGTDAADSYLFSKYYLDSLNPAYSLDSANLYGIQALQNYSALEAKRRKAVAKIGIDSLSVVSHKSYIDSLAFAKAKHENLVAAFQAFINKHPLAAQRDQAITLRNQLAFAEAKQVNTYQSFKDFFSKYPDATEARQAKEVYEILLFETETKEGTLQAYEAFIKKHPDNIYVKEAERRIYDITTASHTIESYKVFAIRYPKSAFATDAWEWIASLLPDKFTVQDFLKAHPQLQNERLKKRIEANNTSYLPVIEAYRYGFIDISGKLRVAPAYDSIPEDYRCGDVGKDHLVVYRASKAGALDKTGQIIVPFHYKTIEEFSPGVLLAASDTARELINLQNGLVLLEGFEEYEPLGTKLIKVAKGGKWGLYTYQGRELLATAYDDITEEDGYLIVLQDGKYAVTTFDLLRPVLEDKTVYLEFIYNEVQPLVADYLLVRVGEGKGIIGRQFRSIIPTNAQDIQPAPNGWVVKKGGRFYLHQQNGKLINPTGFEKVLVNRNFYGAKAGNKWGILTRNGEEFKGFEYDSVQFLAEDIMLLHVQGNTFASFGQSDLQDFSKFARIEVLTNFYSRKPEENVVYYLSTTDASGKKQLYTSKGKLLLPGKYDRISLLNGNLLLLEQNKLTGLADANGKIVLPLQYQGAGTFGHQFVNIFKNGKFGIFNPVSGKVVAPQYDATAQLYHEGSRFYITLQKNKYGLINEDNQPVIPFSYDEIMFWKPTTALVREGTAWYYYDIAKKTRLSASFDQLSRLKNDKDDVAFKVSQNDKSGIVSSQWGEILPLKYDEIVILGSKENPYYFASIYHEADRTYQVDYIDAKGKTFYSKVLPEDQYDRIVCD